MAFRTTTADIRGDTYRLRELSGGATEAISALEGGEYVQALAVLALSLCDERGVPLHTADTLERGLAYVRDLPSGVIQELTTAAAVLNGLGMEDARGN